jgi:hypothetical protein
MLSAWLYLYATDMLLVTVIVLLMHVIAERGTNPDPILSIRLVDALSRYDGDAVTAAAPVRSIHTGLALGF